MNPINIEYMFDNYAFVFVLQEGLNILHCAAINNHTEIIEYIVNDLQMKELDKEDNVSTWISPPPPSNSPVKSSLA